MRFTGLRLTNWMRFEGTHEIDLGPGVHAVVARDEIDDSRSNWIGKSSLLATFRFVLFGTVPTDTIDGAITRGTDELAVDAEFDDGMFITRSRKRGVAKKSLRVVVPDGKGGEVELHGDDAQDAIVERLGLDEDDFTATSFFEQKAMARIVKATPADRTATVAGWLALERVEVAQRAAAADLVGEQATANSLYVEARRLADERAGLPDRATLAAEVEALAGQLDAAEGLARARERGVEAAARWDGAHAAAAGRPRAEADLAAALADLAKAPAPPPAAVRATALARYEAARDEAGQAARQARSCEAVACGAFDGACPVTAGRCPVADQINRGRGAAEAQLREARKLAAAAKAKADAEAVGVNALDGVAESHARLERAVAHLRAVLAACPLPPEGERPGVPERVDTRAIADVLGRKRAALARIDWIDARAGEIGPLADESARRCELLALASTILGRRGAQRVLCERACTSFERGANERLARAGIVLRVRLVWGRPTQQLDDVCQACGAAFPSSAKVKTCPKCDGPRGAKSDEKLHVDLTDTSGAAEDLAGIALQLAAASWLRTNRGSPWSVLVLDEPFGALDEHNRRALAASLTSMIGDGFDQAFVVAHDRAILDALPHRVEIVGHGDRSEVVAS